MSTLVHDLLRHAAQRPSDVAMREKDFGRWKEYTWADYADRVARAAAGLRDLGVKPGDRVAIHSENRTQWLVADLAIQALGAISVGIYPTSPAAEVEYLLEHSGAVVNIAEDEEQVDKVSEVRDRLPGLRELIVIDPRGVRAENVRRWSEVEATEPLDLEAAVAALDPAATAIIVYTSGTTGPPKGAMISHANLQYSAASFRAALQVSHADEVLSYLPLCHVAERLYSVVNAVSTGYTVNFGEGGESFGTDLREVQPTIFLGVPRVWEKMLAGVEVRMNDASRLKRTIYRHALRRGAKLARARMSGALSPVQRAEAAVLHALAFRALREKLGLLRIHTPSSGAAPIAPQVLEFFWALGVCVREGYGMTENTAVCTWTPADDVRIGKVGKALDGVELKIADDGEILTRSAGVFQGYYSNEEATRETIDPDGWLHTGDVGEIDGDGFLTITDRKKDIMITAGGKNIAPSEIENRLKVSPYIREAIVIGDRRKFLTALIGIELDTVSDWAARRGLAFTTYSDLTAKEEVRVLVGEWVEKVNGELASAEQVKRFALLDKELDHEDGELTATQKVKRAAIAKQFEEVVEDLYGQDARSRHQTAGQDAPSEVTS